MKKILDFLLEHKGTISAFITALIALLYIFCSCGTTRAVVRNSADNTTTTISITTNNPTSVQASPDVQLKMVPIDSTIK